MKKKDEKDILWFLTKKKPSLPVADNDSSQCEKKERMWESQAASSGKEQCSSHPFSPAAKLGGAGSDEDSQCVSEGDHDASSSEPEAESPSSSSGPVGPNDISQCRAASSVQPSKNYSAPLGPDD
ncbi:hypothetical protein PGIGA_G00233380 [Pangasianodon gigas]|uniref:Uncharacterized protein n=1 Tax=Pangasianodon gigas TaxID=30993 RepID=A0ACC5WLJ5_PANGG|nr:hypothetical protein [Pangasianodon gigas]